MKYGDRVLRRFRNQFGYIKDIDEPLYYVEWENGFTGWYSDQIIEWAPTVTELKTMIDSALDRKDKKAFMELTEKLKLSTDC